MLPGALGGMWFQATELLKLMMKYQPEDRKAKQQRLKEIAAAKEAGKDPAPSKPPKVLKFGLKHVTTLVEEQKASLVVIANDVNPIELVVWLPALCRKMGVPYCIIKSKVWSIRLRLTALCGSRRSGPVPVCPPGSGGPLV